MYVYSVQEKINTVVGWLKVYYVILLVDMLARASFTCWDDINVIPSATSFANLMRSPDVSDLLIPCRLPYTRPPLLRLSLRRSFRLPLDRYSTMMYRGSNRTNYDLLFFFWSQTTNTSVHAQADLHKKYQNKGFVLMTSPQNIVESTFWRVRSLTTLYQVELKFWVLN